MKIVKVQPTENMLSLTWMIGSRCNYDCMYCPVELHDSTSAHPNFEKLKTAWLSFYNKTQAANIPYKIGFTGGEVTANKNFLPLIEYLRSEDFNIGQLNVTTNGSASLNYYKKLSALVDSISFSTHSEFINEKHFFNTVEVVDRIMIRPKKSLHVNIMNEFWNQDRIAIYTAWLTERNISHSVNAINYIQQTRDQPILNGTLNLND